MKKSFVGLLYTVAIAMNMMGTKEKPIILTKEQQIEMIMSSLNCSKKEAKKFIKICNNTKNFV